MKKILHALVLALLLPMFVNAQATWSEPLKKEAKRESNNIICSDESGFYTIKNPGVSGHVKIVKYDNSFNVIREVELFEVLQTVCELKDYEDVGESILIFTTEVNKKEKKNELCVHKFDKASFAVVSKTVIAEQTKETNVSFSLSGTTVERVINFKVKFSPDKKHFCVFNKPEGDEGNYTIDVFDINIKKEWSKNLNCKNLHTYSIDNNSNAAFIRYEDAGYTLTYLSNQGTDETKVILPEVKKFFAIFNINANASNELIISGLFSDYSFYCAKGTVYFKFDPNSKKIVEHKITSFKDEFIKSNYDEKEYEKVLKQKEKGKIKSIEILGVSLKDSYIDSDGSIIIMGEQGSAASQMTTTHNPLGNPHLTGSQRSVANTTTQTTTTYSFKNVIIAKLSSNGEMQWERKIEKNQQTRLMYDNHKSFFFYSHNNNYYFFHADIEDNFEGKDKKYVISDAGYKVLALTTITNSGEQSIKLLEKTKIFLSYQPPVFKKIGDKIYM